MATIARNISIHHVLCPTDFSEPAARAFEEAVRVARWFGAKVTVLHVIPPFVAVNGEMVYPTPMGEVREGRIAELKSFIEATDHRDVPIELSCGEGDPAREIRETAREIGAGLIVMGTHGRSGLGKLVLGSVTDAVLRHTTVPVLAVRPDARRRKGPFRRILCAADVSEWSAGTVGFALAMAGEGADRLTVLHVIEDVPEMVARAQGMIGLPDVERYRRNVEREAVVSLQRLIPDEARVSCRIEEHVTFGEAHREIARIAAAENADLIVIGTHGRGALDRLFFGSTMQRVVRAGRCPVLVVPAGHAWPTTSLATTHETAAV